jgi:hypothetical protein
MWTPTMHKRVPPDRTGRKIAGWTEDAARGNRAFLFSVDPLGLAGDLGYAVTLTLAETPATSADWSASIDRFLKTMRRVGMVRYHWVTEWTKRGRPHLHASIFFAGRDPIVEPPNPYNPADALAVLRRGRAPVGDGWADYPAGYLGRVVGPHGRNQLFAGDRTGLNAGTSICDWYTDQVYADAIFSAWQRSTGQALSAHAQHVERIRDMGGWSAYTAKHAGRGVHHYQRQSMTLPDGWASSGRLWARGGDWPRRDDAYQVDDLSGFRFRRCLRRWLRSKVKAKLSRLRGNSLKVRQHRAALLRELSHVSGDRPQALGYSGDARAWSEVCGSSSFAPAVVQASIWEWSISHPAAVVIDLATGEVLREPVSD